GVILGQALNLVNGPTIANAVHDPNNRIARLATSNIDDEELVRQLFLSLLCRLPSENEMAAGLEALKGYEEERQVLVAALETYQREELPKRTAQWAQSARATVQWNVLTA